MISLATLLVLYMFIAAVAGMQILGNAIPFEARARYTDFGISLLTVFQCMTGQGWNDIMIDAIKYTDSYVVVIYFVIVMVFGQFIVLNLFVAILLSDFSPGEPPEISVALIVYTVLPFLKPKETEAQAHERMTLEENKRALETVEFTAAQISHMSLGQQHQLKRRLHAEAAARRARFGVREGKHGSVEMVAIQNNLRMKRREANSVARLRLSGVSLGFLPPESRFRQCARDICRHPMFENLVLGCIIFSSITLACNGPTANLKTASWRALNVIDFIFMLIFTFEAACKIVTLGLYDTPDAYLKDNWNCLDIAIVFIGWLSSEYAFLGMSGGGAASGLRTLRTLRALRPLRTIQRLPGVRLTVEVLFQCVPVFMNISTVVFFVFFVFAVMGSQFFAGRFWRCNDPGVDSVDQCWGCFKDPTMSLPNPHCQAGYSKRHWTNSHMNFDNVLNGMLTLFQYEGQQLWLRVWYNAMDADPNASRVAHGSDDFPYGMQPKQEQNPAAALFFVFFTVFGVFVSMNLFVGAVVEKFNQLKKENGGSSPLQTEEQAQYAETMAIMAQVTPFRVPLPPRHPRRGELWYYFGVVGFRFRLYCYQLVMWDTSGKGLGSTFDAYIATCVFANIVVMGMSAWTRLPDGAAYSAGAEFLVAIQQTNYQANLNLANNVFTFIFLAEMLLKWSAWGLRHYFLTGWNQLDFVLVSSSVVSFIVETLLTTGTFPLNPSIFRILRVARLTRALKALKLMKGIKGIARLIETLQQAIPAISNVAGLSFLVIFIFAVMAMDFFGYDQIDQQFYGTGMYNRHANFRYFGQAFMVLFRTITGESWNGIMLGVRNAKCDKAQSPTRITGQPYDPHYCGAPHHQAWIFFVIFQIFVTGLLFETNVAIVLDVFGKVNEHDLLPVSAEMLQNFNDHWVKLDPDARQRIEQHQLLPFLLSVRPPIFVLPDADPKPGKGKKGGDDDDEAAVAAAAAAAQRALAAYAEHEVVKMGISLVIDQRDHKVYVNFVDVTVAVVRYLYLAKLGAKYAEALDATLIDSPELTTAMLNAYPSLDKVAQMETVDPALEFAVEKIQSIGRMRKERKAVRARREALEREVTDLRGLGPEVPESIKALSSRELMEVLRAARAAARAAAEADADAKLFANGRSSPRFHGTMGRMSVGRRH
jgi:hypothetical protein